MDYKALCIELFGTADVEKLREIAKKVKKKNDRNAGRKKKFNDADILNMREMLGNGKSIDEVAQHFKTSRQVIWKYLNQRREPGYTLRMTYMYKQYACTVIDVNFLEKKIMIQNRTNDMLHRAFGVIEEPTWEDFEEFLLERCFPATRGNAKDILQDLGLTDYDPLQIVEKTQGRMAGDDLWLKFSYYPSMK